MMRFEQHGEKNLTVATWFKNYYFLACIHRRLAPQNWCAAHGHLRLKRSWLSEVVSVRLCSPPPPPHTLLELPLFRTEGMVSVFRNDCRLIISHIRDFMEKGDYYLLWIFIKSTANPGGSQEKNPEEWHSYTDEPRKLRINFKTKPKFQVWNIRIDDSQRTDGEIHLGLQTCSKGVSKTQLYPAN